VGQLAKGVWLMAKVAVKKKGKGGIQPQVRAWYVQTEARYRVAKSVYEAQDSQTQEVISRIRDRLVSYSTGLIEFRSEGGERHIVHVDAVYIDFNALYLAVGVMSDLAMVGVKVSSFQFPPGVCSECGALLTPKKGGRRGKS
jgi:hypothetical protein